MIVDATIRPYQRPPTSAGGERDEARGDAPHHDDHGRRAEERRRNAWRDSSAPNPSHEAQPSRVAGRTDATPSTWRPTLPASFSGSLRSSASSDTSASVDPHQHRQRGP